MNITILVATPDAKSCPFTDIQLFIFMIRNHLLQSVKFALKNDSLDIASFKPAYLIQPSFLHGISMLVQ